MFVLSSLIQKYRCAYCQQSYIGSTLLQLFRRYAQHKGISFRTDRLLTRPDHSSIRNHCFNLDHSFNMSKFPIIDSSAVLDRRLLEFIPINNSRPETNNNQTATLVNVLRCCFILLDNNFSIMLITKPLKYL